jgi:hypothetical protein
MIFIHLSLSCLDYALMLPRAASDKWHRNRTNLRLRSFLVSADIAARVGKPYFLGWAATISRHRMEPSD